jgi:hypothetical protein
MYNINHNGFNLAEIFSIANIVKLKPSWLFANVQYKERWQCESKWFGISNGEVSDVLNVIKFQKVECRATRTRNKRDGRIGCLVLCRPVTLTVHLLLKLCVRDYPSSVRMDSFKGTVHCLYESCAFMFSNRNFKTSDHLELVFIKHIVQDKMEICTVDTNVLVLNLGS